jgi:hypothetical protein
MSRYQVVEPEYIGMTWPGPFNIKEPRHFGAVVRTFGMGTISNIQSTSPSCFAMLGLVRSVRATLSLIFSSFFYHLSSFWCCPPFGSFSHYFCFRIQKPVRRVDILSFRTSVLFQIAFGDASSAFNDCLIRAPFSP